MEPFAQQDDIHVALIKLGKWAEQSGWKAYDTFDGLSSPLAGVLTLNVPLLRQIWQQGVRRFPLNMRPLLGIKPSMSSKGMGYFAQGYLRLYQTHRDQEHLDRMKFCLQWLIDNCSDGYSGFCWGNHFDYQSRGGCIPKGTPSIVWTGLIGQAFLDAFDAFGTDRYLAVANSACECIIKDFGWTEHDEGICLNYTPTARSLIHNSNMIGASLLARVNAISPSERYRALAERAVQFTLHHQTPQGAWYYGVGEKWKWVDSFHTGYVLEALETFCRCTGSDQYLPMLKKGYRCFVERFFEPDGTPKYYDNKTPPIDIQCASQSIQTLVKLRALHSQSLEIAVKVAYWTIANMQDRSGYFYYRKYPLITNKTPTLHWGQATMFAALALLDQHFHSTQEGASRQVAAQVRLQT